MPDKSDLPVSYVYCMQCGELDDLDDMVQTADPTATDSEIGDLVFCIDCYSDSQVF